ncbi:MAG: Dam family site-specific DNA-(adenine-N6)-methyltransferase [Bacillales bacterium]|nr:Dam family site-specific DNA-(adenine-N6)-methyltransferase [Bacillales bacterium]
MVRSPFFYVGDKYKLVEQFKVVFPDKINRLFEPFCGGGSVFLNIQASKYIANDNNTYMIRLHEFLSENSKDEKNFFNNLESLIEEYGFSASALGKNVSKELKQKYPKTHYAVFNKIQYKKLKNDFNANKNDMMKLYLLLIYGFNHMLRFNRTGDFNLPVGDVDYNKNVKTAIHNYFEFMKQNEVKFYCEDFQNFIANFRFSSDDLIYFDPPYLISSSEYNKCWTIEEEKRLLKLIDSLNEKGIKFALSNVFFHKGKENTILIEWSKKYKVYDIKSNYISYHDNSIKNSKEVLITNF